MKNPGVFLLRGSHNPVYLNTNLACAYPHFRANLTAEEGDAIRPIGHTL
jgi:hypothetical protein